MSKKLRLLFKRIARSSLVKKLVCRIVYFYVKFVKFTSKINYEFPQDIDKINNEPAIYIFWHGRLLLISDYPPSNLVTYGLISDHIDGQLIAQLVSYSGAITIFGSTNRNSSKALREILKVLKAGNSLMMTPDGPRGPKEQINGALIEIAALTSTPIIPITYAARSYKKLSSWDSFIIPYGFNKISIKIGEKIIIPKNINQDEILQLKEKVREAMVQLTLKAEKEVMENK